MAKIGWKREHLIEGFSEFVAILLHERGPGITDDAWSYLLAMMEVHELPPKITENVNLTRGEKWRRMSEKEYAQMHDEVAQAICHTKINNGKVVDFTPWRLLDMQKLLKVAKKAQNIFDCVERND